MRNIWLVFKNEVITLVFRRSFFLTLILLPVISFVIITLVTSLQPGGENSNPIADILMPSNKSKKEGFVDQSGLVKAIPSSLAKRLIQFENEEKARQAIDKEEISDFFIILPNYIQDGKVNYIRPDFNPLAGMDQSGIVS